MTTYKTTFLDVHEKLHQMKTQSRIKIYWSDRRINYFLEDCRKRWGNNFLLRDMPNKVASYLMQYLLAYEQVYITLRNANMTWDEPFITSFFMQHSTKDAKGKPTNRLALDKWKQLEVMCRNEYIPF